MRWSAPQGARIPLLLRHARRGARSGADAARYFDSYAGAIAAIGRTAGNATLLTGQAFR